MRPLQESLILKAGNISQIQRINLKDQLQKAVAGRIYASLVFFIIKININSQQKLRLNRYQL